MSVRCADSKIDFEQMSGAAKEKTNSPTHLNTKNITDQWKCSGSEEKKNKEERNRKARKKVAGWKIKAITNRNPALKRKAREKILNVEFNQKSETEPTTNTTIGTINYYLWH